MISKFRTMKKYNSLTAAFLIILFPMLGFAQDMSVDMADSMRSDGKIFVVLGVIGIILAGLLVYLLMIDKKVRILEKLSGKK